MASWGYYLEVAGWPFLLATHSDAYDGYLRNDTRTLLKERGTYAQEQRTDLLTGQAEIGGISLEMLATAAMVAELRPVIGSPRTRLTADLTRIATTVSVADTSTFPATGTIWVGEEAISYSAKTATVFAGCGRGSLQTTAVAHEQYSAADGGRFPEVTGYCPTWQGRRCWLFRYERPGDGSPGTAVAAGQIEGMEWGAAGDGARVLRIRIESMWAALMRRKALGSPFAEGTLVGDWDAMHPTWVQVQLADADLPLPDAHATYAGGVRFAMVGEGEDAELVSYDYVQHPYDSTTVVGVHAVGARTLNVGSSVGIETNDALDIGTTPSQRNAVARVSTIGTPGIVELKDPLTTPTAGGEFVDVVSRCIVEGVTRGLKGTPRPQKWPAKTNIREIRILEGDQLDLYLRLLLSLAGDGLNHAQYDTLPPGWGMGLPAAAVNATALQKLSVRSGARLYFAQEPMELEEFTSRLARATMARIYGDTGGAVTAELARQVYPGDGADSLGVSEIQADGLTRMKPAPIYNLWVWTFDRPIMQQGGEPEEIERLQHPDSAHRHGQRALEEMEDPGAYAETSRGQAVIVADCMFGRYGAPAMIATGEVDYETALTLSVGNRVKLTWPYGPDLQGGDGYSAAIFEVTAISLQDMDGTAEVELHCIERADLRNCLIAPAARVASAVPGTPGTVTLTTGTDFGDQDDINYWQVDDCVRLWRRSTIGGVGTSAVATVTAINVGTATLTLSTVPAWAGVGDLLEPDDYAAFSGTPNETDWRGIYGAWADSSTELVGGDPAYTWGT